MILVSLCKAGHRDMKQVGVLLRLLKDGHKEQLKESGGRRSRKRKSLGPRPKMSRGNRQSKPIKKD